MSYPNSPNLNKVVENIVEEVLWERAKQQENQEIAPKKEIEVEVGDVRAFKKYLAKKGFVEGKGFREIVVPFKEEIEKRGSEKVCKQLELGIRSIMKEFYANLGDRKNLTCYIRGRWFPFRERAISQLLRLRPGGDNTKYDQLQKSPNFEEMERELTGGKEE